jgi:hypothetical protein
MEVEDAPPPTLTPATGQFIAVKEEAFSIMLSPEDCDMNFLLCFRGLANNFSYSKV